MTDVPRVIRDIAAIYAKTPLDTLRAKQAFGAAYVNAARLDSELYAAYRGFAATALAGLQAGPNRDLDVINLARSLDPGCGRARSMSSATALRETKAKRNARCLA